MGAPYPVWCKLLVTYGGLCLAGTGLILVVSALVSFTFPQSQRPRKLRSICISGTALMLAGVVTWSAGIVMRTSFVPEQGDPSGGHRQVALQRP